MHAYTVRFIDRMDENRNRQTGIAMPKGIKVLLAGEQEDDWSPRPALSFPALFVGSHSYASRYVMMSLSPGIAPPEDGRIYDCAVRTSRKNVVNRVIDRAEVDPARVDHALVMLEGFLDVTHPIPEPQPCFHRGENGYLCHWVDLSVSNSSCTECGIKLDDQYNHPMDGTRYDFYYLDYKKPEGVELLAEGARNEIIPCNLVSMAPGTQIRLVSRAHDGRREFMLKCRLENGVPVLAYSNIRRA